MNLREEEVEMKERRRTRNRKKGERKQIQEEKKNNSKSKRVTLHTFSFCPAFLVLFEQKSCSLDSATCEISLDNTA